jgi:valyl-tRNA synthetase
MLHPVMPHITEELFAYLPLPEKPPFIMQAQWPVLPEDYLDTGAERRIERAFEVTRALRALRAELRITPRDVLPVAYFEGDLVGVEDIVRTQAWVEDLRQGCPSEMHISTTAAGVDLHLPVGEGIDRDAEVARLEKEREKLTVELAKLSQRLDDPNFVGRAKPEIVTRERERAEEIRANVVKLDGRILMFGGEAAPGDTRFE